MKFGFSQIDISKFSNLAAITTLIFFSLLYAIFSFNYKIFYKFGHLKIPYLDDKIISELCGHGPVLIKDVNYTVC
jgi:hypothetical protein